MTSQLPQQDESLVERVRKLLDKAARTDNEHEADVFSHKAAQLVARHRIDPERLADRPSSDELTVIEVPVGRGAYVRARIALLGAIAEAHDVRMVFQARPDGTVAMLAGFGDELRLVEVIYTSLHQQASTQMAAIKQGTGAATQRQRRAFLFGFADRIGEMLTEARSNIEANERAAGASGDQMVLVVQQRQDRVDAFATTQWGKVRSASAPSSVSPTGFERGVRAAERADVGRSRLGGRRALGSGS